VLLGVSLASKGDDLQITAPSLFDRAIACWDNGRNGRSHEGLIDARAVLAEAAKAGDEQAMAAANRAIGWFCLQMGYPDEGIVAANDARTYYASQNDDWGYAISMAVYSWLVLEIGLSDISFETASDAVVAAARTDDLALNAFAVNCKALALVMSNEAEVADALLEQARSLADASGDESTIALSFVNSAFAALKCADMAADAEELEKANALRECGLELNQHAILVARQCGDLWNLRTALCNGAESLSIFGRTDAALGYLDEVEKLPDTPGPRGEGHLHHTKGDVLERLGRDAEALACYIRAERLATGFSLHDQMVQVFKRLAEIHAKLGDYQTAYTYHQTYHHAYVRQISDLVRQRTMVLEMQLQTETLRKRAEELEMQVGIDLLTNVPNRRSFNRDFEAVNHHQAVLGILDIDYFKHVNDLHSHAVGDLVLQRVAQTISSLSEAMHIYRIGGEEFAVLFPDMSLEEAEPLARDSVDAVRNLDFRDVAENLRVTISVGLVESGVLTGAALLAEADRRLYVAKKSGRDQVICDNRPSLVAVPAE
jgi:diguanylate cyclase (GGDEF)-like protein